MRIYRWVRREDGAMHLQGREAGRRHVSELGTVTEAKGGYIWETADGMWGDMEPTLGMAMASLELKVRYRR